MEFSASVAFFFLALLFWICTLVSCQEKSSFEFFRIVYGKLYNSKIDQKMRQKIFEINMMRIERHNIKENSTYRLAPNAFADTTLKEFSKILTLKANPNLRNPPVKSNLSMNLADTIDWRSKGVVTPVKNQGICGSCWAFTTTGALEGLHAIKSGRLLSFSEQQLVDCDETNSGCNGGLMNMAFRWIVRNNNRGLASSAAYFYNGEDSNICRTNITNAATILSNYRDVVSSIQDLKAAVNIQPIAVAVDASSWRFYAGGVFNGCNTSQVNHGVLLVGYTSDSWIVKNSWGRNWGEGGYIRIKITQDSPLRMCGITQMASYPVA